LGERRGRGAEALPRHPRGKSEGDAIIRVLITSGLTQLLIEVLVLMSWRAAIGGEAIPQTVGETASAVYDRLAVT